MKRFEVKTASVTDKSCTVVFGNTRLSVLTPCLVRVEKGNFCDEPTQRVWERDFERPVFTCEQKGRVVHIVTDKAHFMYSLRSGSMRRIILADGRKVTHFSRGNLKGTRRTLDGCDGAVPLESCRKLGYGTAAEPAAQPEFGAAAERRRKRQQKS